MGSGKKISIITVNLNNRKGLEKTINSVIHQSFTDYEFLIIDGGSTDGSIDIINALATRIDYWVSEPDNGIYHAMNKGLTSATGEYCLFLNSGDWLTSTGLSEAAQTCTGEDIIYFNCYLSYNASQVYKQTYPQRLTLRSFYKRTIGHQSTLIRKDLFARHGIYTESYQLHADYEFWIKAIIIGNADYKYVDKFLCYYDMSGLSTANSTLSQLEVDTILNRYLPKRVLDDYTYWHNKEQEMEILAWYKAQKPLYAGLVFMYRIVKNLKRILFNKTT